MRQIVYFRPDGKIVRVVATETNSALRYGSEDSIVVHADSPIDPSAFEVVGGNLTSIEHEQQTKEPEQTQ